MSRQALEGLKVLDLSWAVTGPLSMLGLAAHGATVVKMESGTRLDSQRFSGPYVDSTPGTNRSSKFAIYNANKYSVSVNLKHPKAPEIVGRLFAWADLAAETFSAGTLDRLGIGYDEMVKTNPDIILISSNALGSGGPLSDQVAVGNSLAALVGFPSLCGWPDRPPSYVYGAYTDFISCRYMTALALAAVESHHRTGKGMHLEISQYEAGLQFLSPLLLDYIVNGRDFTRVGNRSPSAAPHGVFPCRGDDSWCAIAVCSQKDWKELCSALGNPEWAQSKKFATFAQRKKNEDELETLLGTRTMQFTRRELMNLLQEHNIPAAAVHTARDVYEDPQLNHRHHFQVIEHPEMRQFPVEMPGFRLSESPNEIRRGPPCLGEHNYYVCTELLGYTDDEFIRLTADGALA